MKNIFCTKLPLKVYSNLNYKNTGKETGRFTAIQIHKAHTNTDWLECPDHFPPVLTNPSLNFIRFFPLPRRGARPASRRGKGKKNESGM